MPLFPIKRKLKKFSDTELLSSFLEGNNMELLGELFARYMHLVYGVCLKYLNDRETSKDAVMQVFEIVHSSVYKHPIDNFKSWLYVVTKNFCLMELRKNKQKTKRWPEEFISVFMEKEPEIHLIDSEQDLDLEKNLLDCIKKLKDEQQKCIRLFYFENRNYRQIASEMNLEEKKIKSFIQNGKRNLRICLEKQK